MLTALIILTLAIIGPIAALIVALTVANYAEAALGVGWLNTIVLSLTLYLLVRPVLNC